MREARRAGTKAATPPTAISTEAAMEYMAALAAWMPNNCDSTYRPTANAGSAQFEGDTIQICQDLDWLYPGLIAWKPALAEPVRRGVLSGMAVVCPRRPVALKKVSGCAAVWE